MLLNCKFCGGELEPIEGASITTCKYCRTAQTLPKSTDDNLKNLFNRANALRRRNEFDKAEAAYEKIIEADGSEAEAYWGLVLCKYGIEYVEDPASGKMIPTCHRASYDSVTADGDFKAALQNADAERRALYEEQVKEIDRIQKDILALAGKEDTYDVFICYKETDENGKRTHDSVIANDIYYQLTDAGYKVFFAAITLEGKLGRDYEPIIFAALNSAKVMLAVGSKPEYFNAVWVKNEWSRYLKILKKDRKKLLIPCYRDMDPYDLPEEFSHLQAQDMGKIGFITDLIRGIKKVMDSFNTAPAVIKETVKETVIKEPVIKETTVIREGGATGGSVSVVTPLIKRVFAFLEDGDFKSADEYCERVLDIELENAEAYVGKLMSELKIKKKSDLKTAAKPFDTNANYVKAVRYGGEALKKELSGYLDEVNRRCEEERKEDVYLSAMDDYKSSDISRLKEAINKFTSILGFKDAAEKIDACRTKIKKAEEVRRARERADELRRQEEEARRRREAEIAEAARAERARVAAEEAAKRKKRIITLAIIGAVIFVAFIMILVYQNVILPEIRSKQMQFELAEDGESYILSGAGYKIGPEVVIPDTHKGKPVTKIASDAFRSRVNVTSVTIPDSVTEIGERAFDLCENLTSVTLGNGVKTIGTEAFSYCKKLTAVVIPNSVEEIGQYAFEYCSKLTSVTVGENVKRISGGAFYCCFGLTNIVIPDSVTEIDYYAFNGCTFLRSVTIGKSVTSIGADAFTNCIELETVIHTGTASSWSKITFYGEKANPLYYAETLYIDNAIVNDVVIEGEGKIGDYAFMNYKRLNSVTIGDGITEIGVNAFVGCDELKTVTIGDGVLKIPDNAFLNCKKIETVTIGSSVKVIGEYAFFNCTQLKNINYYGTPESWSAVEKGEKWNYYNDGLDKQLIFSLWCRSK